MIRERAEIMEQMTQTGPAGADGSAGAQAEKEKQIEAEAKALIKQYEAALAQGEWAGGCALELRSRRRWAELDPDSPGPGESGVPHWAWQEWGVILKERDAGLSGELRNLVFSATGASCRHT